MKSIREYEGEVRVCGSCGQPCYLGPTECGEQWQHFSEQWDGVTCPRFPLSGAPLVIHWASLALRDVKATYPNARGASAGTA